MRPLVCHIIGGIVGIVTSWIVGVAITMPVWSGAATIALCGILLIIGLVAWSWVQRPRPIGTTIALVIWLTLCGLIICPFPQRLMCGIEGLKRDMDLRAIVEAASKRLERDNALPPSFAVMIAESPELRRIFELRPCCHLLTRDVQVGPYSLADVDSGKLTLEQFRQEALRYPPAEVERIGTLCFWRNVDAWKAQVVVIAWREPDDARWDWAAVATAEPICIAVDFADAAERSWLVGAAKSVGMVYPDEFSQFMQKYGQR